MNERSELDLTRRRVLGSLGAVGIASVGAGMGTSAYFSDEETYEENRLVAGELDLKVDWEEHYSDWSEDESEGLIHPVRMSPPQDTTEWIGLPDPRNPLVWVHQDDIGTFMANTAVEAYPDENDDGLQDLILTRSQLSGTMIGASPEEVEEAFRAQFADVPANLDSDRRTESSRGDPLVQLSDVKPGDFGEVTFSLHLFDNPGYIWLTGTLVENAENGYTEPEANDPDEDQVPDDTEGELPEEIRVLVWHDDGDNVLEDPEIVASPHNVDEPSSIQPSLSQAIVAEGTLGAVLDDLANGGIALDADPTTAERDCYPNSTTRHVGFAWWLPVDHANEIQTDSVSFDLGFYTEQCRHNDGSGQALDGG